MRDKNHMTISRESEKASIIPTLIHDKKKTSEQSGYGGNISQPNTGCIAATHSQYIQQ